MKLQLLNRNITLVYDSLDLGLVSADKIRQALGIGASLGMQPDGIVALVPEQSCIVQLANKRLSVTSSKPVEEIADKFITNLTMSLHDAIPSDRAKLLAYGLNYEIVVPAADPNVRQRMLETLLGDIDAINEILGGKLVSARPTLLFLRKGVPHELTVEPSDDEHLKFFLNVHREGQGITPPNNERLWAEFLEGFAALAITVSSLFTRAGANE